LKRLKAEEWLRNRLGDGPVSASEIEREYPEQGLTKAAVQAASVRLGVLKAPPTVRAPWVWSLPEDI